MGAGDGLGSGKPSPVPDLLLVSHSRRSTAVSTASLAWALEEVTAWGGGRGRGQGAGGGALGQRPGRGGSGPRGSESLSAQRHMEAVTEPGSQSLPLSRLSHQPGHTAAVTQRAEVSPPPRITPPTPTDSDTALRLDSAHRATKSRLPTVLGTLCQSHNH